jgi:membrane-associated phospholipid phosphatase
MPAKAKAARALKIPKAAKDATLLEKADVAVARAAAPYSETPLVRAISQIGKLGDQPPMRLLSGLTLAAGLLSGNGRLARAGLRMAAAHELATLGKNFVKHRIDRTRPQVLTREGRYKMQPGDHEAKEETSFPSGHSAGAVAVGRAFARDFPEHKALAHGGAAAIALAQIPRCTHYPTDVAVGIAIGAAAEALVSAILPHEAGDRSEVGDFGILNKVNQKNSSKRRF